MQTVDKAMTLLGLFSEHLPEVGLSEMSRLAGFDKATTQRLLASLTKHAMLEKHPDTKKYRLGAGLLRLARVRESSYPIKAVVEPLLEGLARETGETAHFSLALGDGLATIGLVESRRANRVSMEAGELLPFHGTASGLAYLAFAPPAVVEAALHGPLDAFTEMTLTDPATLRSRLEEVRRDGVSKSDQSYEAEVCGIAAPVFERTGTACGAIAVATPTSRMTAEVEAANRAAVRRAAVAITVALGGEPHPVLVNGDVERQPGAAA